MYRLAVVLALVASAIAWEPTNEANDGSLWHKTPFTNQNGATQYYHLSDNPMSFEEAIEYCKPAFSDNYYGGDYYAGFGGYDYGYYDIYAAYYNGYDYYKRKIGKKGKPGRKGWRKDKRRGGAQRSALWCPESAEETEGILANLYYKPQLDQVQAGVPALTILSNNPGVWTGIKRDENFDAYTEELSNYQCHAQNDNNPVYPDWQTPADNMWAPNDILHPKNKKADNQCVATGVLFSFKWQQNACTSVDDAHGQTVNGLTSTEPGQPKNTQGGLAVAKAMCVSDDVFLSELAADDYDEELVADFKEKIRKMRKEFEKAAMILAIFMAFFGTFFGFCCFCFCCCCCCKPCKKTEEEAVVVTATATAAAAAAPPPMAAAPPMPPMGAPMQPPMGAPPMGYGMQQPMGYGMQPMQQPMQQPMGGINITCNNNNTNSNR